MVPTYHAYKQICFQLVKASFVRLETMRGVAKHRSAFTPRIDHILVGEKRTARELALEPSNMDILPKEALKHAERLCGPTCASIDLHAFRIIFHWLLYTKKCCRWNCINHSNDRMEEKAISVKFPKSKNNQYVVRC